MSENTAQAREIAAKYRTLAKRAVELGLHNEAHRLAGVAVELEEQGNRAAEQEGQ